MIILDCVTKLVGEGAKRRPVLDRVNAQLPSSRRIAVLGPRPQDNKAFINLISGAEHPDSGRVVRRSKVSFPVGYRGGLTPNLSVRLNVAHVARLHQAEIEPVVEFVKKFSNIGAAYDKPYRDLSTIAKRDLAHILTFSIPFDVYLLSDDLLASNPVRELFEARCKTSGIIMASEDLALARQFCDMGLVLSEGRVELFKNIDRAIAAAEAATVAAAAAAAEDRKPKPKVGKKVAHKKSGKPGRAAKIQ